MMLEHLSLDAGASLVVRGVETTLKEGMMTQDLARLAGTKSVGTSEFSREVIARLV
jgi:isocitrate dehydrogenase